MIIFFELGENLLNKSERKPLYSGSFAEPTDEQPAPGEKGKLFEIRVKGQLTDIWADWFDGMTIQYLDNEEMLLCGSIVDQSALMGVLNKLVRLNLTLISINEIKNK